MTIDEAIKHAEEIADSHDRIKQIKAVTLEECKCASEHRQLAEWLRELKQLREQTRWIPVSERLPEESGNYLIAIADSNYKNGQFFEISWFYPSTHRWSYLNADVIAWMPLPEPYKAESEEEDANSN